MTIDPQKLTQAIYDTIFDSMSATGPAELGKPPTLDAKEFFLSLSMPGRMINVADVANPWSPNNTAGNPYSLEYMSKLLDVVPLMQTYYAPRGTSLEARYGQLVGGQAVPQPDDPKVVEQYNRAYELLHADGTDFDDGGKPIVVKVDSPLYAKYKKMKAAYNSAYTNFLTWYLSVDLSTPDGQRAFSILGPAKQEPVNQAWDDLQNAKAVAVENALAILSEGSSNLDTILANAKKQFEQTTRKTQDNLSTFHPSYAIPANWFTEAMAENFTHVTIDSNSLRTNDTSKSLDAGGDLKADMGLFGANATAGHTESSSTNDKETKNVKIDFKFGRVDIQRNWMDASFFGMKGVYIKGVQPASLADGRGLGDVGLLPVALIVARDVSISADWGSTELKQAQEATNASAKVSYGPFSISGHYDTKAESRAFASAFDGRTISIPGVQIIGYMSRILPMTPVEVSPS